MGKATIQDVMKVAQTKVEKKEKLNPLEFTVFMVFNKRGDFHGINPIFSGFNEAYRSYFPGQDVVADLKEIAKTGLVASGTRWPHTLYFPSELPDGGAKKTEGVSGKAADMLAAVGVNTPPTMVLRKGNDGSMVLRKVDQVVGKGVLDALVGMKEKTESELFAEFVAWKNSKN
jgi:hypothetical protein